LLKDFARNLLALRTASDRTIENTALKMTDSSKPKDGAKGGNILDCVIDAILPPPQPKTAAEFVAALPPGHGLNGVPYPGHDAIRKLRASSEAPWFTSEQAAKLRKLQTAWRNIERAVNDHCGPQAKAKFFEMAAANVERAEAGQPLKGALTRDELETRFEEQRRLFRVRQNELGNAARAILETALPAIFETAERVAGEIEAAHQACYVPWGLSAPACTTAIMLRHAAGKLALNLVPTKLNTFPNLSGWVD